MTNLYLAFIAVSIAVIVIPGPSILLIVSNSLQLGVRSGLHTVAGTSAAMLLQLTVAVLGITSLVVALSQWLNVFRWLGILYLCYLGISRWRSTTQSGRFGTSERRRGGSTFGEGFIVSLTNPTTMLFFVAFFPQFLDETLPAGRQFITMSTTFWILAIVFDVTYACLASRLGQFLHGQKWIVLRNRLAGGLLIAAAVALALARA